MQIHVVRPGDTIETIANQYDISLELLLRDNQLSLTTELVIGQSLVIVKPLETYIVQTNDTLQEIADSHKVTLMQLYRNNPFLADRNYIYPGEILVIRYNNSKGLMTTHGSIFPYIDMNILKKTLPYLTYLSVINYTATDEGEIISYFDDSDLVEVIKDYDVMPLMLLTTLTIQGKANIGIAYNLLLNKEYQKRQIENIINILRTKGYYGINISLQYINISTLGVYEDYLSNIFRSLSQAGFYVFVTISPGIRIIDNTTLIEEIDFRIINKFSHNIIFMSYEWSTTINPPSPIASIPNISIFLNYLTSNISPDNVIIGIPTIGYDWSLPFVAGYSDISLLSYQSAIDLAIDMDTIIEFDETSQTPFYLYYVSENTNPIQHIVWFIDARSINGLLDLAIEYGLLGSGIWDVMNYSPQLWLLINSQYEIEKFI
jgi:spore germination protein